MKILNVRELKFALFTQAFTNLSHCYDVNMHDDIHILFTFIKYHGKVFSIVSNQYWDSLLNSPQFTFNKQGQLGKRLKKIYISLPLSF